MIYTSIILLTVLEIFSLNEWENISLFLTNFLCLEEFAGVIVLLYVTLPSSPAPHYLLIILITYWSNEFPSLAEITLSQVQPTNSEELTLIAMMDLACSWKIAWRGGGTFTERSMVSEKMSECSMLAAGPALSTSSQSCRAVLE